MKSLFTQENIEPREQQEEVTRCLCGFFPAITHRNLDYGSAEFDAVWLECAGCGYKTWSHLWFDFASSRKAAIEEWNKKQVPHGN